MTNEEALEFAKGGLQTYYEKYPELTEQIEFQKAIIDALKKVAQLEKENKELKETRIPMKPTCIIETPLLGTSKTYFCPRCNSIVWLGDKHCPECGQCLDWSK